MGGLRRERRMLNRHVRLSQRDTERAERRDSMKNLAAVFRAARAAREIADMESEADVIRERMKARTESTTTPEQTK